jgi:2-polyprenyl-6-methoxyphenol hydroxylase-like FAD-dependent oxidoreductase
MNERTNRPSSYDAIIVGARVAGASTAMLLARAGLRVLALEKSTYGSDTLSTLALMRPAVIQLHRWGVLDQITAAGTPAIRTTTFHYGSDAIEVPIQERDGVDSLYAPRRTVLDAALVDAARNAGAHVVHSAHVNEILSDDSGRVCGVTFTDGHRVTHRAEANIVIGADGVRSAVARSVNATTIREGYRPGSYLYGFWRGLDLNGTHWYFDHDVAAGTIPTNDDLAVVFVGMRPARYRSRETGFDALFDRVLAENNEILAANVKRAEQVGKLHPFPGRAGLIRQSWGAGWALVGDAGCFKDPLTAHGMTDALRDAELLASAVITGTNGALAEYQSQRDEIATEFVELSDEIASFDWDLDRVQLLHHRLSKLMATEADRLREFAAVQ